jgi:hypothetical protein
MMTELRPDALYMIRGGHIKRYHGEKSWKGRLYSAFGDPSDDDGTWGIGRDDVLYEVTAEHARALRVRHVGLLSRQLDTTEHVIVMRELGVTPSPIPKEILARWGAHG